MRASRRSFRCEILIRRDELGNRSTLHRDTIARGLSRLYGCRFDRFGEITIGRIGWHAHIIGPIDKTLKRYRLDLLGECPVLDDLAFRGARTR